MPPLATTFSVPVPLPCQNIFLPICFEWTGHTLGSLCDNDDSTLELDNLQSPVIYMIFIWFWEVFHLTGVFLLKQCAGWLAGFLSIFFFVCFVSFRFVFWAPYKTYRSPRGKAPEIHYSHYVSALRPWRGVSSLGQSPSSVLTGQPWDLSGLSYYLASENPILWFGFPWDPNTYSLQTVSAYYLKPVLLANSYVKADCFAYFPPAPGWLHTI